MTQLAYAVQIGKTIGLLTICTVAPQQMYRKLKQDGASDQHVKTLGLDTHKGLREAGQCLVKPRPGVRRKYLTHFWQPGLHVPGKKLALPCQVGNRDVVR
jgi:hypothetical protein